MRELIDASAEIAQIQIYFRLVLDLLGANIWQIQEGINQQYCIGNVQQSLYSLSDLNSG